MAINATWNPDASDFYGGGITFSNGNLTTTTTDQGQGFPGYVRATHDLGIDKYYWELTNVRDMGQQGGTQTQMNSFGIADATRNIGAIRIQDVGFVSDTGLIITGTSGLETYRIEPITDGDVIAFAVWTTANIYVRWMYFKNITKGGTWNGVNADPNSNNQAINIGWGAPLISPYLSSGNNIGNWVVNANFGDSPFVGIVPPNYKPGFPGIHDAQRGRNAIVLA